MVPQSTRPPRPLDPVAAEDSKALRTNTQVISFPPTPEHPARPDTEPQPFRPAHTDTLLALVAVMATSFIVVAPFLFYGNASGHDFAFHVASWMDVARQWHQGLLYPRWAAWAHYGFGEPRFIFYPPFSWLLGAALGWILPWTLVPGVYIWLSLTIAGMSMYRLAREWMPPSDAMLAAVLFAANPYHLLIVYFRSDFAELLASGLFPLLVHYALRLSGDRSPWQQVAPLSLAFAGIWLTNAPAAVIATYSLTLVVAVLAAMRRSAKILLTGAAAMAFGFLLVGFYIVPAAFEQAWVNIQQALSSGLRPEQNFLFYSINDPEHNLFNLLASTIAVAQMAMAGFAAVASHRPGRRLIETAREAWWAILAVGVASTVLMLPISQLGWRYLPKLRFVQFPWRWSLAIGTAFAFFMAAAIRRTRAKTLWTVLMAATLIAIGGYLVHQAWWDSQDLVVLQAAISQGKGYEGTDEYDVRGGDHTDLPRGVPQVALVYGDQQTKSGRLHIEQWRPDSKLFTVDTRQPITAALRLMNYPAWQAEVNGERIEIGANEDTGQMLIALPAGHCVVHLQFTRTRDRVVGGLLSVAGVGGLLGLAWLHRRRRNTLVQPLSS